MEILERDDIAGTHKLHIKTKISVNITSITLYGRSTRVQCKYLLSSDTPKINKLH